MSAHSASLCVSNEVLRHSGAPCWWFTHHLIQTEEKETGPAARQSELHCLFKSETTNADVTAVSC